MHFRNQLPLYIVKDVLGINKKREEGHFFVVLNALAAIA